MTKDNSEQHSEEDGNHQPTASAGYDSYRSVADSSLVIFVPKHGVPPFRFKAGGWELLRSSVDLNPEAEARVAENGFVIESLNPTGSGESIPGDHEGPAPPSLEVGFALVIARMIDSVANSPEDIRQVVYDLARYKLQEQLLHTNAENREDTRRALEGAIRGVEAFSEKHAQLSASGTATTDRKLSHPPELVPQVTLSPFPELVPHAGPRLRLDAGWNARNAARKSRPWSYLRRTAAMLAILVAVLVAIQQRAGLLSLVHNLPKLDWATVVEERKASPQVDTPLVMAPPPKPAPLRPTDYGVYAINDDTLIELNLLPIRPPDVRVAISAALTMPGRTILPNGRPKFIVFRRDLASGIADRTEVRIIAKVAREFSPTAIGKKPVEDTWVIRNISFPFRSSPVKDNPELIELHSEDSALELTPGRYALVLRTQAYDFTVEGEVADPRQCIERIVSSAGTFYSNCKKP